MVEKNERGGLLRSALTLSIATVISRVLGFIREVIFAALFGANYLTDSFPRRILTALYAPSPTG